MTVCISALFVCYVYCAVYHVLTTYVSSMFQSSIRRNDACLKTVQNRVKKDTEKSRDPKWGKGVCTTVGPWGSNLTLYSFLFPFYLLHRISPPVRNSEIENFIHLWVGTNFICIKLS